jgi:lipid-binding SYLF domain-containing protein
MAKMTKFLFVITAATLSTRAADETTARLDRAPAVFAKLSTAPDGIWPEQINFADCVALVPGYVKGAGEIDIVILSMDRSRRPRLLSDRFAIGSAGAAAWGNGKGAHGDPNAQILFLGSTKGAFAGFGLEGATINGTNPATRPFIESQSQTR